jgi:beta-galactosidase
VIRAVSPRPIEQYDISRGLVAYRVTLPAGPAGVLEAAKVRDLAWVQVDGKPVGTMDTRYRRFKVEIPARSKPATVEILLYTIARVNFGVEIHDRKGLHGPVVFRAAGRRAAGGRELGNPRDRLRCRRRAAGAGLQARPHQGRGVLARRLRGRAHGRHLPRHVRLGPGHRLDQRPLPGTLLEHRPDPDHVPARDPWIRRGRNEVVVLDLTGPREARIAGLKNRSSTSCTGSATWRVRRARRSCSWTASSRRTKASSRPVPRRRTCASRQPVRGRQFCLESLDAFDGKRFAAVAEIALLGKDGKTARAVRLDHRLCQQRGGEQGRRRRTERHQWPEQRLLAHRLQRRQCGAPAPLVIDLGKTVEVAGLRYTPRQGKDDVTGRIRGYRAYVGERAAVRPHLHLRRVGQPERLPLV